MFSATRRWWRRGRPAFGAKATSTFPTTSDMFVSTLGGRASGGPWRRWRRRFQQHSYTNTADVGALLRNQTFRRYMSGETKKAKRLRVFALFAFLFPLFLVKTQRLMCRQ